MKYMGYMPNDFINGEGISVSLWVSGCPLKCKGCHNPESWDPDYGYDIPEDIVDKLIKALFDNNIQRNLSILGGEPLCEDNRHFIRSIIEEIKTKYPKIKIYLWTGYTLNELMEFDDEDILYILNHINVLIEGRFDIKQRDVTLSLRGSKNQNIVHLEV